MKKMKKYLPFALFTAFIIFGINALINSKPIEKNERIYKAIKTYSPYYLEKRFGGFNIKSKQDKDFILKPTNMELFNELAKLEKIWGQKHLKILGNDLVVSDKNKSKQFSIKILSKEELYFIHSYYGITK